MKSRRERRAEARKNKVPFEPQYSSGTRKSPVEVKEKEDGGFEVVGGETYTVGGEPKSYEEMYGAGYERFNDKHVTIKEVEVSVSEDAEIKLEELIKATEGKENPHLDQDFGKPEGKELL